MIVRKDGSEYKLSGSETIKTEDVYFPILSQEKPTVEEIKEIPKEIVIEKEEAIEEIPIIEEIPVIETPVIEENKIEEVKEEEIEKVKDTQIKSKLIKSWCLPVVNGNYGDKFIVDIFIINQTAMGILFWAKEDININSILFPLNKDRRWWKIKSHEKEDIGKIYYASPSITEPDFT